MHRPGFVASLKEAWYSYLRGSGNCLRSFLQRICVQLCYFPFAMVGVYACPCYYYPNRAGTSGRASFVVAVDLKAGAMTSDHWIKRGTALLMSLDY